MDKLILASNSQRRSILLNQIGVPFEVIKIDVNEDSEFNTEVSPYDIVKILSTKKALSVCGKIDYPCIIIAADTVVFFQSKILGKPKGEKDAFDMLKMMQGKEHRVYTGVTIIKRSNGYEDARYIVETTKVTMRTLADEEIYAYIKTGEPFDKAGSYAIQEKGAFLIERVEGDYNNIVGLPLVKLYAELKKLGVDLTAYWK